MKTDDCSLITDHALSNPCASSNFSSSNISIVNPSAIINPSSMMIVRGNNSLTSAISCVDTSKVIGSDETSAQVYGRNWWEWVFVGASCEYHLIVPSRGQDVIEAFMQERKAEVWVCNCWKAQLNAPAQVCQICLSHQIGNLQGLIEKRPRLQWAQEMQALFRKAIHLGKRRWQLTKAGFERQVAILEKHLTQLLQRSFCGLGANLLKRYRKYQDS